MTNTNTTLLEFTFSELEAHIPPLPLRAIVPIGSASKLWHHLAPSMSTLMATKFSHSLCMHAKPLQSHLTPSDTVACKAPLSMGFSRQEYWSGLSCPPSGDLPNKGIEPESFMSPALAGGFFTTSATWEAPLLVYPVIWMPTEVFAID